MTTPSLQSTDPAGAFGEHVSGAMGEPPAASGEDVERTVPMRLQRFLARAGVASRRGSEKLMSAGRVTVNGVVATEMGQKVDPLADEVRLDGEIVVPADGPVYLALHKPPGYMTTMSDPEGRRTVADLFPDDAPPGLFPVGRLDFDTEGLLLLTTDGDLAHRLMHPRHHVEKTYFAWVDGTPDSSDLDALSGGIELEDGPTSDATAKVVREEAGGSVVELVIHEGRKWQVRRMLSAVGHPVKRLVRIAFGPVGLDGLEPGTTRALTETEVERLRSSGD